MAVQYVFASNNLLYTPLLNSEDNVCYEITTVTPTGMLVPVTSVYREGAPTPYLTHRQRGLEGRPSTKTRRKLAEVHWKGVTTKTVVYSTEFPNVNGLSAKKILKKRNVLSLSTRCHFFKGNDRVQYRWKVIGSIGCMLTRNGKEVARCMKRFVTEGMFAGHTKFVLELQPGSETLDIGMLLFTFLIVDHKRQKKDYGSARLAAREDDDPEGEGEFEPGNESGEGHTHGNEA